MEWLCLLAFTLLLADVFDPLAVAVLEANTAAMPPVPEEVLDADAAGELASGVNPSSARSASSRRSSG